MDTNTRATLLNTNKTNVKPYSNYFGNKPKVQGNQPTSRQSRIGQNNTGLSLAKPDNNPESMTNRIREYLGSTGYSPNYELDKASGFLGSSSTNKDGTVFTPFKGAPSKNGVQFLGYTSGNPVSNSTTPTQDTKPKINYLSDKKSLIAKSPSTTTFKNGAYIVDNNGQKVEYTNQFLPSHERQSFSQNVQTNQQLARPLLKTTQNVNEATLVGMDPQDLQFNQPSRQFNFTVPNTPVPAVTTKTPYINVPQQKTIQPINTQNAVPNPVALARKLKRSGIPYSDVKGHNRMSEALGRDVNRVEYNNMLALYGDNSGPEFKVMNTVPNRDYEADAAAAARTKKVNETISNARQQVANQAALGTLFGG